MGLRDHVLDGVQIPQEKGYFRGGHVPANCRANVPTQHTQQTNIFAAARCDKMVMRPLVNLLWTLVIVIVVIMARLHIM